MMKLYKIALPTTLLMALTACQPENPPMTVASSVPEVLAPASSDDLGMLLSYSTQQTGAKGLQNGNLAIQLVVAAEAKELVSGLPNPLRANLRSEGKSWKFIKRSPMASQDIAIYGASLESDAYVGYLGEVLAVANLSSSDLEIEGLRGDPSLRQSVPAGPGWKRSELVSGTVARAGGIVSYALYRSPNNGGRDCVAFLQATSKLVLRGDVCAPRDKPLGKSRAEAIIRGIGIDPAIPIEATPDLSNLPVY